jgi:hypothetical protein
VISLARAALECPSESPLVSNRRTFEGVEESAGLLLNSQVSLGQVQLLLYGEIKSRVKNR